MADSARETRPLTWAVMLSLLAAGSPACNGTKTSSHVTPGTDKEYPAGHPCHGKGNCDFYRRLPDGGAAPPGSDAGQVTICGPCNG